MVRCRYSADTHTTPNSIAKVSAMLSASYRLGAGGKKYPSTTLNRAAGISRAHQAEVDRVLRNSETIRPDQEPRWAAWSVRADISGLLPAEWRLAGRRTGWWSAAGTPVRGSAPP